MKNADEFPEHIQRAGDAVLRTFRLVVAWSFVGLYSVDHMEFETAVLVYLALLLFCHLSDGIE